MADNESTSVTKDLGIVSAYGYAKAAGYTGTEEEFEQIFLEFTENAPGLLDRLDDAVDAAEDAESTAVSAKNAAVDAKDAAVAAAATFTTDTTLAVSGKAADAKVTGDEITGLKTAFEYFVNTKRVRVLEGTYTGTRRVIVNVNLSAGKYLLTVDSITSSDTDADTNVVVFRHTEASGGGTTSLLLDRGSSVEASVQLDEDSESIYLFASDTANHSDGDTLTFENMVIDRVVEEPAASEGDIDSIKSTIKGNGMAYDGKVYLPCVSGSFNYSSYAQFSKDTEIYQVHGRILSSNTRVPLTGTKLDYSTASPTKANRPEWYLDEIPGFVLMHSYRFKILLVEGSYTLDNASDNLYVLIRNDDLSLDKTIENGGIWECTTLPTMLALTFRSGEYSNAKFFIGIEDITDKASDLQTLVSHVNSGTVLKKNPYRNIPWGSTQEIISVSHAHCITQQEFETLQSRYGHLALSNYYPSVPWYPLDKRFEVTSPDLLGSPNSEHARFTGENEHLHINAIGAYVYSPDATLGKTGTLSQFLGEASAAMKIPGGGGMTINHPRWSGLTADKIISIMGMTDKVIGLEVWNASCEMDNQTGDATSLWDEVLAKGYQIYATAVPDHEAQYHPSENRCGFGYNHMLIVNATEDEVLSAYKFGRFYTTLYNDGLLLEQIDLSSAGEVTITVSKESTFLFKTATRSIDIQTPATSANFQTQDGDIYVRVEAYSGSNRLWTNAIMLT